jgi:hypothetical protein
MSPQHPAPTQLRQMDPELSDGHVRFVDACSWSALHRIDSEAELLRELESELCAIVRREDFELFVDCAEAPRPVEPGERALPLLYESRVIGQLLVLGDLSEPAALCIEGLLLHFATALVQLRLRRAERHSLDAYCACVEAMHEGVGLFQEADPEIASARFVELCAGAVRAQAGAVLLREEFGNLTSKLRVEALMSLPESFLDTLNCPDGSWWPETIQGSGLVHLRRDDAEASFRGISQASLPAGLQDIVACPLEYQLFPVGLLLLFNLELQQDERRAKLESLQSLGSLGAVIFHRQAIDKLRADR